MQTEDITWDVQIAIFYCAKNDEKKKKIANLEMTAKVTIQGSQIARVLPKENNVTN